MTFPSGGGGSNKGVGVTWTIKRESHARKGGKKGKALLGRKGFVYLMGNRHDCKETGNDEEKIELGGKTCRCDGERGELKRSK